MWLKTFYFYTIHISTTVNKDRTLPKHVFYCIREPFTAFKLNCALDRLFRCISGNDKINICIFIMEDWTHNFVNQVGLNVMSMGGRRFNGNYNDCCDLPWVVLSTKGVPEVICSGTTIRNK